MRVIRRILRAMLVMVALAALAAGLLVATAPGQQFIAAQVSGLVSSPDQRITLTGLSGLSTGRLRIERVEISDAAGPVADFQDVAIDWSPRALFSRTIAVQRLAIAHSRIMRPLAAGQEAPNDSTPLPDWTLLVDSFDLAEVTLGEGLIQQEARLKAAGSLALDRAPMVARLALQASRIDQTPGSLSANVAFVPAQSQLDLDIALNEPSGGTLARLLDVSGLPALSLSMKGGGTLDDWNADLAIAFDGRQTVTGNAMIAAVTDGHRLTATLAGAPGPLLPRLAMPFAAGNVDLALDVTRKADGSISIATADLASATTRLSARGDMDLADRRVDLSATFSFADQQSEVAFNLPDGSDARLGAIQFDADAKGGLGNADITMAGRIASADTAGYSTRNLAFDLRARGADLAAMTVPFNIRLKADRLQTPFEQANPALQGAVAIDVSGLWRDNTATIESGAMSTAVLKAALTGTVRPFAGLFDAAIEGRMAAAANEQARLAFGEGDIAVKARIARGDDGAIAITGLDAKGTALAIAGDAVLGEAELTASITATTAELNRFQPDISGGIVATIDARGPRTAPNVKLTATGQDISLSGKALSELVLGFDGVLSAEAPRGDLTLNATLEGKALKASGKISSGDGSTQIDDIRFIVGAAEITGAVRRVLSDRPTGSFTIAIPDLAELGPLLLRDDLAGSLSGSIEVAPLDGAPAAKVALTSPTLAVSGISIEQAVVDAVIAMPDGNVSVGGTVRIAALDSGGTAVRDIVLTASSDGTATQFETAAKLDGAPIAARGSMTLVQGVINLALAEANGTLQGIATKLAAPTDLAIRDGNAHIDQARLNVGGGAVTISGMAGETLDLEIALNAFPAAIVDRFAKQGLSGTLSGTLAIKGTPAAPDVAYVINWRDASATPLAAAGLGALTIDAKGNYAGERVRIDAAISGGGLQSRVNGTVALGGAPSGDLSVRGTLPFEMAAPALARAGLRLNGMANLDVQVSGALSSPQIAGTVSTSGAVFVDTGSAIVIRDINATARLAGKSLTIEQLTGTLGSSGRLSVTGSIGTDAATGFPADLAITMRQGRYADDSLVAATFGADLTLKGPLAETPTLGGAVNIERADISLPEKLPNAISPLGVDHVNAPADVIKQNAHLEDVTGSTASGGGLALDLAVNAPRRVFVRGRGLDAELGGSLRLSGTTAATRASGSFRLIRGRLDILTKRLTIDQGTISFSGSLDPIINFSASTSSGTVTASILVSGPASSPRISFSSSPSLPDDEVLAQLLFNKGLTELSPVQIVQLANALSSLTGGGGNTGILGRLRQTLGVDNLDVTADESGEGAAVGVGRYINDKTYIGVKQGTTSGETSVTTNIDLTDTLKAKGEVNSQGKTKAGIFFEKEY